MSRFWPHTPYAEDQPYSHSILTTHVFTRALTMGSMIGPAISTPLYLSRHFNLFSLSPPKSSYQSTILRSAGVGGAVTMGLMCLALPGRMWGREEIEWKDKSWRLLENRGQVETDDWTYGGMVVGGLAYAVRRQGALRLRNAVGSVGLGSVVGTVGYMGYRYVLKGGHKKS